MLKSAKLTGVGSNLYMELENFRYQYKLTVRFADVDVLGHVNNAKYHTYMEEARLLYAQEVYRRDDDPEGIGLILAHTTIDYILPLFQHEGVTIFTRCARLGRKSFDLFYMIVRDKDEELAATAKTTIVCYNYKEDRSQLIPALWRERIQAYETVVPEGS